MSFLISQRRCIVLKSRFGNRHIHFEGSEKKRTISENKVHLKIKNPRERYLICYRVDGGLIHNENQTKCDYLLGVQEKEVLYFIELKGNKLNRAFDQVWETIKHFKDKIHGYTVKVRIIITRFPKSGPNLESATRRVLEEFLTKNGGRNNQLIIKCKNLEETIG